MDTKNGALCSIVIPSYNVGRYIAECIDSVRAAAAQDDFEQTEIIVVNDGSSDDTGKIADGYAARFPNLRVVHQANAGLSGARNSGIRAASGKYVIFVDADDYLVPGSLSVVYDYLRANEDADLLEYDNYELADGTMTIDSGDFVPASGRWQDVFHLLNKASLPHVPVWTKAVSRKLLTEHNLYFYDRIVHEDEEWTPKLFAYAQKAAYLPAPVYVYRTYREDSLMAETKTDGKHNYDYLKVIDSLIAFDSGNNFQAEYSLALKRRAASIWWTILKGLKTNGIYDCALEEELLKRTYLLTYSAAMHRRIFYSWIIKVFGVKAFYMMKYGLKNS